MKKKKHTHTHTHTWRLPEQLAYNTTLAVRCQNVGLILAAMKASLIAALTGYSPDSDFIGGGHSVWFVPGRGGGRIAV